MNIYEFAIPRGNNTIAYIFVIAQNEDAAINYANEKLKDDGIRARVDSSDIILNEQMGATFGVFETINL